MSDKNQLPTLEEVILSLQKSMAKASEITSGVSRYDAGFLLGDRTVYNVHELDIELNGAILDSDGSQSMQIDLDAPSEFRSKLKFKVEPLVHEKLEGPQIIVSKYRSYESDQNRMIQRGMIWAIDENGQPNPDTEFQVHLKTGGMNAKEKVIKNLQTDISGKLNFTLNVSEKSLAFSGVKEPFKISFNKGIEWYMWAQMKFQEGDEAVVDIESELIQVYYP